MKITLSLHARYGYGVASVLRGVLPTAICGSAVMAMDVDLSQLSPEQKETLAKVEEDGRCATFTLDIPQLGPMVMQSLKAALDEEAAAMAKKATRRGVGLDR